TNPSDLGHALGIEDGIKFNLNISGGGDEASFVVAAVMDAVESGAVDTCVLYRSLNSRSGKRLGRLDGAPEVGGARQFGAPDGDAVAADRAAALAATPRERARDLKQTPIPRLGHQLYRNSSNLMSDSSSDYTIMYSSRVGPRLWDQTGLKPKDMDFACLYGCF